MNYKMMGTSLFYVMELLFPLHCCFVCLVFVVVVGGANEKQMTWRLAFEKQSD